jgi:hypothetical protein
MKTRIIVYDWRPYENGLDSTSATQRDDLANAVMSVSSAAASQSPSGTGFTLDLYDDVAIPITYAIADVREPEKKSTPYSKTLTIPGSAQNNRIFNHIFKIDADSSYDPNLKKQCVVYQDGIEVLNGTIQLRRITTTNNNVVSYDIQLYGSLSNLFYAIGDSKLSDLDLSQYKHQWNRSNIVKSWDTSIRKNNVDYSNFVVGTSRTINQAIFESGTSRTILKFSSSHGFQVGDYIQVQGSSQTLNGTHIVTTIVSSTQVAINWPYPLTLTEGTNNVAGTARRHNPTGEGYVYPLINYGITDGTYYNIESMFPSVYAKTLIDAIFKKVGMSYDSAFLNSNMFKRMIVSYSQSEGKINLTRDELNARAFRARTSTTTSVQFGDQGNEQSAPVVRLSFNDDGNNGVSGQQGRMYDPSKVWNTSAYSYKPNASGKYRIISNIRVDSFYRLGQSVTIATASVPKGLVGRNFQNDNKSVLRVRLMVSRNGSPATEVTSTNLTWVTGFSTRLNTPGTYGTNTIVFTLPMQTASIDYELELATTDEVWIDIKYWKENSNKELMAQLVPFQSGGGRGAPPQGGFRWVPVAGTQIFRIQPESIIYNFPSDFITENDIIDPARVLPTTFSCKDFLFGLMKMFNLYIEESRDVPRKYIIEPRDDYYYTNQYVDWTDKVDISSFDQIPMGELAAKTYTFGYKSDGDYWNKLYKDSTGEDYGLRTLDVKNDFLKNTLKIESTFAPTPLVNVPKSTNSNKADIVIPHIASSNGTDLYKPTSHIPRILHYTGLKPCDYYYRIDSKYESFASQQFVATGTFSSGATSSFYTAYPFAGHVDCPFDPYYDFNFWYSKQAYWDFALWSNHNLYNAYWKKQMDEITDKGSRLVTFSANITPTDINQLDFRKIYVIDNVYYRLNKIIDYDATNVGGLTKVELSKFKLVSRWSRKSIYTGVGGSDVYFEKAFDYSGAIATEILEAPPKPWIAIGTSNNSINPITLSNVRPVGRNNQVAPGVRNVRIQGDENAISNDAANIVIQNGNGNSIAGGVQNVTLIGTDKKIVFESDVTYINNIRYKFGVPVSKSNVVDGGIDSAYNRYSVNTTSNVIDAGENVVVPSGSSTFENVVDGGMDRVLPDIPDFGITNFNAAVSRIMPRDPAPVTSAATYSVRDTAFDIRIESSVIPTLYA